jgi:hypothetical protein
LPVRWGADRFLKEIELAARLQHPHILGLLDSGTADDLLYYVRRSESKPALPGAPY